MFPVLIVPSPSPTPFALLCNSSLLFPEWRRGWRRGWWWRWGQWIRRQQQFLILFRRLFWFGLQLNCLSSSTFLAVLYSVFFFRIIVTLQLEIWDGEETEGEGNHCGLIHFLSSQASHCINNVWLWGRGARGRVHNSWQPAEGCTFPFFVGDDSVGKEFHYIIPSSSFPLNLRLWERTGVIAKSRSL